VYRTCLPPGTFPLSGRFRASSSWTFQAALNPISIVSKTEFSHFDRENAPSLFVWLSPPSPDPLLISTSKQVRPSQPLFWTTNPPPPNRAKVTRFCAIKTNFPYLPLTLYLQVKQRESVVRRPVFFLEGADSKFLQSFCCCPHPFPGHEADFPGSFQALPWLTF